MDQSAHDAVAAHWGLVSDADEVAALVPDDEAASLVRYTSDASERVTEYEDVAPTYHRRSLGSSLALAAIIVSVVQYTSAYGRPLADAPRGGGAPGGGAAAAAALPADLPDDGGVAAAAERLALSGADGAPCWSAPNATDGAAGCGTAPRSEPATAEASATTARSAPAAERSAPQQRTLHNAAIEASALVAGDAASASTATPRASLFDVAALAGGCVFVVVGAVAAARRTVRLWTYSAVDSPPAV